MKGGALMGTHDEGVLQWAHPMEGGAPMRTLTILIRHSKRASVMEGNMESAIEDHSLKKVNCLAFMPTLLFLYNHT